MPTAAMESATVEIAMPDGVADAYLARPDEQPHPGVLLIMDAYGLRPAVEEIADRIAGDGYVVLAPNVFYRSARSPVVPLDNLGPEVFETIRPMMEELTPERVASDAVAYLDYLANSGGEGKVAITGYCMGGRVGWWMTTAHSGRIAALAAFHTGGLVTDAPDSPHRSAAALDGSRLYFGFADNDRNMTPDQIATLERALDQAGVRYRAEVYAGAAHGYTMVDLPVYDEAARERHFRELRSLLEQTVDEEPRQ